MKLELSQEWCLKAAEREGDQPISAGRLALTLEHPEVKALFESLYPQPYFRVMNDKNTANTKT
jgi:hypothetical protein